MQSEIDRLKQQLEERENVLTDTREELKSVKETLGQLQSLLEQKEVEEVEIRPQNIMDWPVPIPEDKPEKLIDPLKPTKVNTGLSDPSLTPAEDPEKSRHKA